jgi:hypothetical protein
MNEVSDHTENTTPLTHEEILVGKISKLEKQIGIIHKLLVAALNERTVFQDTPIRTLAEASAFLRISNSQVRRLVKSGVLKAKPLNPLVKKSRLFFDIKDLQQFHHFRHNRRLSPTERKDFNDK